MTGRLLLRTAAALMAVALVVLWFFLVRYLFAASGNVPAPAVFMLPLFFVILAMGAFVGAVRDEPIVLLVAAGLSLVPSGAVLLFMPGFARWIGILDVGLIVIGLVLLRGAVVEPEGVEPGRLELN